jgi:K+-transporting ATPase ATPase C chain
VKDLHALFRQSLAGLRVLVLLTLLLGLAYPLAVTGVAALALPWRANGSLVSSSGEHVTDAHRAVGSALLGQLVDGDGLFQPRPSAAGEGYDPLNTSGSNLGPENRDLVRSIEQRRAAVATREGVAPGAVPPDALTASGSGLDPDISPDYADLQVARVARANGLTEEQVRGLVEDHTSTRTLGVLGEPRVNVLELNIDVLRLAGRH